MCHEWGISYIEKAQKRSGSLEMLLCVRKAFKCVISCLLVCSTDHIPLIFMLKPTY